MGPLTEQAQVVRRQHQKDKASRQVDSEARIRRPRRIYVRTTLQLLIVICRCQDVIP